MLIDQLKEIMENFYLCTHLPLRVFNTHGEELLSTGFMPGMVTYQKEVNNWLNTAPYTSTSTSSKTLLTFSPADSICFSLFPLYNNVSFNEGYFIMGPYTTNITLKEAFAFKPSHCIPHLIELLYSLGDATNLAQSTPIFLEDYNYHISRAQAYIKEHYFAPITLDILAEHLGLNKSYLCTIFKKATKESFCNYTNKVRISEGKKLLKDTNESMTEIALAVGFSSASYFNTIFKKFEGKTPLEYRKELL